MRKCLLALPLLALTLGCGAQIKAVKQRSLRLGAYPRLYLSMKTPAATYVVDPETLRAKSDGTEQFLADAELESVLALEEVAFRLTNLGFKLAARPQEADLVARFGLNGVRWDLTAWVADQAYLELKDPDTAAIVALYRARPGFLVPTVDDMVAQICDSVEKDW